jgi:hypothetical protein
LFGTASFNEIRYFDDVWDADGDFDNRIRYPWLWDLYAVRYVVAPTGSAQVDSFMTVGDRFRPVLTGVMTPGGVPATLFERTDPAPWARVVPGALRVDTSRVIPTLLNPQMDFSRLVLFTPDIPLTLAPITAMPAPSASHATVTAWEPGRMSIALDPAPDSASYLVVAENWYPDWHATVDGAPVTTVRGDWALLTVPIPAHAKKVELWFQSPGYAVGRGVSIASVGVTLLLLLIPGILRRRQIG